MAASEAAAASFCAAPKAAAEMKSKAAGDKIGAMVHLTQSKDFFCWTRQFIFHVEGTSPPPLANDKCWIPRVMIPLVTGIRDCVQGHDCGRNETAMRQPATKDRRREHYFPPTNNNR